MKNNRGMIRAALEILAVLLFLYLLTAFVWAYRVTPAIVEQESKSHPFDLAHLPKEFIPILVRVEDPSFFTNPGLDPFSRGQGLTTMTQALTRTLLLSNEIVVSGSAGVVQNFFLGVQTVAHKIDIGRDVMALAFNLRCSKQQQLQLFLTHVYMGSANGTQVYGLAEAARIYYRTVPEKLRHDQIVGLIAMMIAPNQYHPIERPDAHKERVKRIERLLQKQCRPNGVLDTRLDGCARD